MSDLPAGVPREKLNIWPYVGAVLTALSMGVATIQYIGSVNAKADYALAQISEIKQNQRQASSDTREDLKGINAKLDNLTLLIGRNGTTTNGKY